MKECETRFSRQEQGRLRVFGHVLAQAHAAEQAIPKGKDLSCIWRLPGTPVEVIFAIDQHCVNTLKRIAYDIYESDFVDKPELKAVADGMTTGAHVTQREH